MSKRVKVLFKLRPDILLSDNIPMPMHGRAPRTILGQKWWKDVRNQAYASTGQRCLACGIHRSKAKHHRHLEGHEVYNINYQLGRMIYKETVPLCHACHSYIHDGRMDFMVSVGKLSKSRYVSIIRHGDQLLRRHNLVRPNRIERELKMINLITQGKCAKWADWRLIVYDKEIEPLCKTPEEYMEHWEGKVPDYWIHNS